MKWYIASWQDIYAEQAGSQIIMANSVEQVKRLVWQAYGDLIVTVKLLDEDKEQT